MRLCTTCEDEFLDIPENWTRVSKNINTGLCRLCTNDNFKRLYKNKIDCADYPERMRTCSKCKIELVDLNDNWKRRSIIKMTGTCKTCNHDWSKKHYWKHRKEYSVKNREYRTKTKEISK